MTITLSRNDVIFIVWGGFVICYLCFIFGIYLCHRSHYSDEVIFDFEKENQI